MPLLHPQVTADDIRPHCLQAPGLEDGDEGSPKLHTNIHLNLINKGFYLLMTKIAFPAPKQLQNPSILFTPLPTQTTSQLLS